MIRGPRARLVLSAVVAAAAACDKQPAGPGVNPTPESTATVQAVVERDTALSSATPKFAPGAGVRVNIRALGDTSSTPLRQVTANAQGRVTFVGLAPGTYIIEPSVRAQTSFPGRRADTVQVAAGDTVAADTVRVRLGASIAGFLASEVLDQTTLVRTRFPNVQLIFWREVPGPITNTYVPFDTVVTDATGAFSVPALPSAARYRITFNTSQMQGLTNDTLQARASGFSGGPRGEITFTSTGGLAPDRNEIRNIVFTLGSFVTGTAFRDANGNGALDIGEGLVAGDTVRVQLRNAEGTRIIATSGALTSATATSNRYTFSSVAPGTYTIAVDPFASRFATTTPPVNTAALAALRLAAVVPNSVTGDTVHVAIPVGTP